MTNAARLSKTCNDVARDGWVIAFILIALRTNGVAWAQSVPWWTMAISPAAAALVAVAARRVGKRRDFAGWLVLGPLIIVQLGIIVWLLSGTLAT